MKKKAKATETSVATTSPSLVQCGVAPEGVALIDESLLKSKIYTIRGVKVMLDVDLAEIYGYETKRFNEQVKNNLERFDEQFRFQLKKEELELLRTKFSATKISPKSRSLPFAFTEQGIYMLMTVLKGEKAANQSKALIILFKKMKDYIIAENHLLPNCANCVQIATLTAQHSQEIAEIRTDVKTLADKTDLLQQENRKNCESLAKIMDNFVDPSAFKHFLILNGQKLEADVAYTQIYGIAKSSILIVDNYVGVKTLDLLRGVAAGVKVTILGDQRGSGALTPQIVADFKAARPDVELELKPGASKFHDRYIVLDSGQPGEKLFHCGASSKDAGNKITTIMEIENAGMYHDVF